MARVFASKERSMNDVLKNATSPAAVDRVAYQAEVDKVRLREKAHRQESGAIAAARRRLGRDWKRDAPTRSASLR
jgi:hypothetical protein